MTFTLEQPKKVAPMAMPTWLVSRKLDCEIFGSPKASLEWKITRKKSWVRFTIHLDGAQYTGEAFGTGYRDSTSLGFEELKSTFYSAGVNLLVDANASLAKLCGPHQRETTARHLREDIEVLWDSTLYGWNLK